MLFASFLWPIIDALATLILTWLEVLKSKLSIKLALYQKDAQEKLAPEEPPKRQIGFCVPAPVEVLEEEDEEDYDD